VTFQVRNGCDVELTAQGDAGDAIPGVDLGSELRFRPHSGSPRRGGQRLRANPAQGPGVGVRNCSNRDLGSGAIDIVLKRFAEYHDLEGAFGRRAVTERAKGILRERHNVDEQAAFDILRDQARRTHRKLVDIADAVVASRSMLPARPSATSEATGRQEA
jgi:hypothetical protein